MKKSAYIKVAVLPILGITGTFFLFSGQGMSRLSVWTTYPAEKLFSYQAQIQNSTTAYFAKDTQDYILQLRRDDHTLTIAPIVKNRRSFAKCNDTSITYPDIFPYVDLEYKTIKEGIKENLILHKYTGQNTFKFKLISSNGLYYKRTQDGRIQFRDVVSDELVFNLPKPYMKDSPVPSLNYTGSTISSIP